MDAESYISAPNKIQRSHVIAEKFRFTDHVKIFKVKLPEPDTIKGI